MQKPNADVSSLYVFFSSLSFETGTLLNLELNDWLDWLRPESP